MTGLELPGSEVRVVDRRGQDVAADGQTVGEIVARSNVVMKGYWKQPEETAKVLKQGWFHTGDLATVDAEGYLMIVDRKKDIIVRGGENISSIEIEKTLFSHPGRAGVRRHCGAGPQVGRVAQGPGGPQGRNRTLRTGAEAVLQAKAGRLQDTLQRGTPDRPAQGGDGENSEKGAAGALSAAPWERCPARGMTA